MLTATSSRLYFLFISYHHSFLPPPPCISFPSLLSSLSSFFCPKDHLPLHLHPPPGHNPPFSPCLRLPNNPCMQTYTTLQQQTSNEWPPLITGEILTLLLKVFFVYTPLRTPKTKQWGESPSFWPFLNPQRSNKPKFENQNVTALSISPPPPALLSPITPRRGLVWWQSLARISTDLGDQERYPRDHMTGGPHPSWRLWNTLYLLSLTTIPYRIPPSHTPRICVYLVARPLSPVFY